MVLLLKAGRETPESWLKAFADTMPELEVRLWPDCGKPEDVQYALVSRMPGGELRQFPNLRFIASMSVGVEHLLDDPELPLGIPLVRNINPQRASTMAEYVTYHVLRQFRQFPIYEAQQAAKVWQRHPKQDAAETRVGIMGLGSLGRTVADKLRQFRFQIAGWTRTPHHHDGIVNFVGDAGFHPFLASCDFLVCLLPLTAQTENILDAAAFATLKQGAYVINAGRGEHVVDEALIAALDSGHLAGATMDPFREEPLPTSHPFWSHPKITITPHNSCDGRANYGVVNIVDNIRRSRDGRPLVNLVDRKAGY